MKRTCFVSPYTQRAIDSLKIAALYFDNVQLIQNALITVEPEDKSRPMQEGDIGVVKDIRPFIDELFIQQIKPLIDENIITVGEEQKKSDEVELSGKLMKAFKSNIKLLFEEHDVKYNAAGEKETALLKFVDPDIRSVQERYVEPIAKGATIDFGFLVRYYEALFRDAVLGIRDGDNIITSSEGVLRFIEYCYTEEILKSSELRKLVATNLEPRIVAGMLKAMLLDVSNLDCEDILEARLKLSDELIAFRETVQDLQLDIAHKYTFEELLIDSELKINSVVRPKLKDIETKIQDSKLVTFKKLLAVLRSPDAYVPFLGTAFVGLPLGIALVVSLGIASIEVALEYDHEQKQLNENGLMYMIKVKDRIAKNQR
jgi:hypothetical protein